MSESLLKTTVQFPQSTFFGIVYFPFSHNDIIVKIGVLLSGGVDSSVALLAVKAQYPEAKITAFYLKIWLEDELTSLSSCPWKEDLEYVGKVCDIARIPLRIISLQREYWDQIVADTVAELKAGRTPSPDIFCNRKIKFGAFLEKTGESLDKIASGHYAVAEQNTSGLYCIKRSPDPVKDQTYFLSYLTQSQASLALFPIGHYIKKEVRALAERWNLPNKLRKDSQGICFLGRIKYSRFVEHYLGTEKGPIVEVRTGRILGTHRGTWFYTIGQRTGLGLSGGPWYVVHRNNKENIITVGHGKVAMEEAVNRFNVINPNWISGEPILPADVTMKLRHGPKLISGRIESLTPTEDGMKRLGVYMDESDSGVAPGQFAVFYDGTQCLGGAMIEGHL